MSDLACYQRRFLHALRDTESTFSSARQPAFDVYRNTTLRGCIDALEANYPAVACLVGRDWFRAAAAAYIEVSPPTDVRMLFYGDGFASFLDDAPQAAELPYLGDVARLDRLWTESQHAADDTPLPAAAWAMLGADELATMRVRPHASLRLFRAPRPAVTIWRASRDGRPVGDDLPWRAECAIVIRPHMNVTVLDVDPAALSLIQMCASGHSLGDAIVHTLDLYPDVAIDRILGGCQLAGVFALSPGEPSP
ncbi:MAG: hypothetical protein GAK28_01270 [Luteibacter sp.]|uniref:HvfC/BufC N-terminal domain-containing protein n=1 Tax=Luteibacter sp. TaxID=1886636 RepID=UPI001385AD15|nr:DNA-binding domain-containing protein [Luteibacter sp.]KAF1008289.1 MAG: hypothetical protein GAK28_01270 [Luteibacter sp.]